MYALILSGITFLLLASGIWAMIEALRSYDED